MKFKQLVPSGYCYFKLLKVKVSIITCFFVFAITVVSNAQYHLELMRAYGNSLPFSDLQRQVEKFYQNKDKGKGSGYKQWKRYEWWQSMHLQPDGKVASITEKAQVAQAWVKQNFAQHANTGAWRVVGPTWNQGLATGNGRPNCIAFHPFNNNIIYVGFPLGGMWRGTVNPGGTSATWEPMTDDIPVAAVSSIAIDPTNANIIYMLTGDGNRGEGFSIGLLKSNDGGVTWNKTGLVFNRTDNQFGYKVMVNPLRPATIFVTTNRGIYYSHNEGISFSRATFANNTNVPGCYDIEWAPNDTTRMVASGFAFIGSSSDGGRTWVNRSAGNLPAGSRRIALAVSPAAPAGTVYMYIGIRDSANVGGNMVSRFKGLYRSLDYGVTYTLRTNSPNISGYNYDGSDRERDQSDIDMDLAVSPINGNLLLAGTHNVWRSTNGGASFGSNAVSLWTGDPGIPYIHEDINFITYRPDGARVYVGSDGGVYCSNDNGTTWNDLTYGLIISQFYRINVHPVNNDIIVNGAQDAAGNVRVGATAEFKEVNGGDGMSCMIDFGNANILYTSYAKDLYRSTTGGPNAVNVKPPDVEGNWVNPIAMNYFDPAIIFYGASSPDDIYRSTNRGDDWVNIGGSAMTDLITCPSNTNRLYAVTGNTLLRTDNALAANPANITYTTFSPGSGLPPGINNNSPITRIAVDPSNSSNVWISVGGYNDTAKVFRSSNAGASWQNMSAGLPNIPILCIVHQNNASRPGAVYVGTDIGVFYRDDILGGWIAFRNNLPPSPVTDLRINHGSGMLRAGTYGRGIWESPLYTNCAVSILLTGEQAGYQFHQASSSITFSGRANQGYGNELHLKSNGVITFTEGTRIGNGSYVRAYLGPCGSGVPDAGANAIIQQAAAAVQASGEKVSELYILPPEKQEQPPEN
jgi:photosystem II stability/assembly factor-like uncharacterized protein